MGLTALNRHDEYHKATGHNNRDPTRVQQLSPGVQVNARSVAKWVKMLKEEAGIAQLVQRPIEMPGVILIRVQWHALTSMQTLKILNYGSHTTVWVHKNTTHTDRNG